MTVQGWDGQPGAPTLTRGRRLVPREKGFSGEPRQHKGLKITWPCEHGRLSVIPSCLHTSLQTGLCDLGYEHACGLGQASRSLLKIRVDSQAVCPKLDLCLFSPSFEKGKLKRKNIGPHTFPKQSNQEANTSRDWE